MTQSSYSSIKQICGDVGLINLSHCSDCTRVHCRRRAWLKTSGNHIGMTSSYLEVKPLQHLSCCCTINYRKTNILSSSETTSATFLSFFVFLHIFTVSFSSLFSCSSKSVSLKAIPDDLGPEQQGGDDDEEGGDSRKKDLGQLL